jgi:hypothetical protein
MIFTATLIKLQVPHGTIYRKYLTTAEKQKKIFYFTVIFIQFNRKDVILPAFFYQHKFFPFCDEFEKAFV